jgi:hypothetical protein
MEHARANAESMELKSPIDGVVVLNTIWKQGKMGQVQDGDQVQAGVTFMQVVDPSSMQVRASVNQEDFLSLRFGDAAQIHLDAYPDLVFPGKLVEMAPIARGGDFSNKLRSFAVVFSIRGTAFGIGANTAMFAVLNAVLRRPLPLPDPDRVVRILSIERGALIGPSPLDVRDFAAQSRSFENFTVYDSGEKTSARLAEAPNLNNCRSDWFRESTFGFSA